MTAPTSPPILRRSVGIRLRHTREQQGRALGDVARSLGWSESKLSRIETGQSGIGIKDLERLLDLYGTEDEERSRLAWMAQQARRRAWWETYSKALFDAYETFIGFEADASYIGIYGVTAVPGLLQTEAYARAIMVADRLQDDVLRDRIDVRMKRQALLMKEPAVELTVVLDEAVLRRPIGGHDGLQGQLSWLRTASSRPATKIHVLPYSAGAHRALGGTFNILSIPGELDFSVVYVESLSGGFLVDKSDVVAEYISRFDDLRSAALTPKKSLDFISRVASGKI